MVRLVWKCWLFSWCMLIILLVLVDGIGMGVNSWVCICVRLVLVISIVSGLLSRVWLV